MIHFGSWNIGSLTGKLRKLVDTVIRIRVNILCVQETKEVNNIDFKPWYTKNKVKMM
jgi:exonuclease III